MMDRLTRLTWLGGVLIACEGNLDASIGFIRSWDGVTAMHLFNEIERVHGKLWTAHTSRENLENAKIKSSDRPNELLWDSSFIRELCCSIMDLDLGEFYTRPNGRKVE